jgi:selenocysteine-specific elongation factor
VAAFRDRAGIGRGLAVEVVECLDRLGVTQRIGDVRVMRPDFTRVVGAAAAPPPPAPKAAPRTTAPPAKPAAGARAQPGHRR